jgi:hypothetical protein
MKSKKGHFVMLIVKGTPPPLLFCRYPDFKDGAADRAETFTTNRTPKMIVHVFKEKFFLWVFSGFFENVSFFRGLHLATGNPQKI